MNKNFYQKASLLLITLTTSLMNAQDLGLASGASKMLDELVRAFPFIAGIAFLWVGKKALNEYNNSNDNMAAGKIIVWYILTVLFIVGAYKVVKNVSL